MGRQEARQQVELRQQRHIILTAHLKVIETLEVLSQGWANFPTGGAIMRFKIVKEEPDKGQTAGVFW